ncbi:Murein DD-endopeptidase MepM and murein hydrolase activator NlpD, contain LysM domain [Polaribacter sp. KT25b]|uniref:M23 family metallopeptidase n=1 Tax=Polaribacter sp. KT25b TaxID=1855336 RepID=UPI00087CF10A|nr:M23 family metallopeptidase [Polaribacter sp. KT25b]SDR66605.1 Murein DD-endopeptidase MepM and murein hydrolase activator NlpD, contain LysM domain [Polaribacter sp. KT25b]
MAKVKYYYDENTLSYRKITVKKSDSYKRVFLIFLAVIIIAFIGFVGFSQIIMSPTALAQKRELENLKFHFELLNKRLEESSAILAQLQERDNNIYRSYFEANPITEEQRKAGFGGVNRYKVLDGYDNSKLIKDITKEVDVLSKQMVVQSKSLDEIITLAKKKEDMLASIPAILPIKKEDLTSVASGYKMRMHPILKIKKFHKGMDFTARIGTPIYASGNGKVTVASRSSSYGNVVYIDHGYGYETIYAHMSKIKARRGQMVKRGDLIGYVGNTGLSVAAHLHYEVHKNGIALNPINFYYGDLSLDEFAELQKSSEESQSFD